MNTDDLDPYSPMDSQEILSSEIEKHAVGIVKLQIKYDKLELENKKLKLLLSFLMDRLHCAANTSNTIVKKELDEA